MKASRDKAYAKRIDNLSFKICRIGKSLLNGIQDHSSIIIKYSFNINSLRYAYENKTRTVKNGTEFAYTG